MSPVQNSSKNKARSRDGRWTVIPGAYVSRWEPYAEAHEPRQGQPPWGSYGPEECCPDAPPSSARPHVGALATNFQREETTSPKRPFVTPARRREGNAK